MYQARTELKELFPRVCQYYVYFHHLRRIDASDYQAARLNSILNQADANYREAARYAYNAAVRNGISPTAFLTDGMEFLAKKSSPRHYCEKRILFRKNFNANNFIETYLDHYRGSGYSDSVFDRLWLNEDTFRCIKDDVLAILNRHIQLTYEILGSCTERNMQTGDLTVSLECLINTRQALEVFELVRKDPTALVFIPDEIEIEPIPLNAGSFAPNALRYRYFSGNEGSPQQGDKCTFSCFQYKNGEEPVSGVVKAVDEQSSMSYGVWGNYIRITREVCNMLTKQDLTIDQDQ